jgi:Na+/phosphate symporter
MKKNMGNLDRSVRLILAAVFAFLFFSGNVSGLLGYVLLGLAAIFTLTSLLSNCPLYALFGISTCPVKKAG